MPRTAHAIIDPSITRSAAKSEGPRPWRKVVMRRNRTPPGRPRSPDLLLLHLVGLDGFGQEVLPVLDLHDHGRLDRVAFGIERDDPRDAVEVLRRRDLVADLGAVGRPGLLDRRREDARRVVSESGERVRKLA